MNGRGSITYSSKMTDIVKRGPYVGTVPFQERLQNIVYHRYSTVYRMGSRGGVRLEGKPANSDTLEHE